MKILLIGCGKMGQLICNALKENQKVTSVTVCDPKYPKVFTEDGIHFVPSYLNLDIPSFHSVFVATPAEMHYSNIVDLINRGAKRIYVEKPSVTTLDEYEHLKQIAGDCKIAVGYILRQSDTAITLKNYIKDIEKDGYSPEVCTVTYQKYLPYGSDERAKTDIGVDEELVHVYDMVFNFFGFGKGAIKNTCRTIEYDPKKNNRILYARFAYLIQFGKHISLIHLKSSFRSKVQCREFFFAFNNHKGQRRYVRLAFDTHELKDILSITSESRELLFYQEYPSLEKLNHQLDEVLHYFKTGDSRNLALLDDSLTVIKHMQKNSNRL